ncbi:hypothetical protein AOQ84DRAFT_283363 [Glonium stellatum]|uniref:Nucleolar protein 12 n=1 Tax=Glonium stellatum TaxID=574774 RepID=A0A8E2JXZ3_9PEZI|nr:hypothetical protein AOQ84DRAFT_283363 [Glonium stellatum]
MAPPTKRRKISAVEEITFDPAAREEFLTGFHKRKLARAKHAQEEAAKKEREERVRQRRELRQQRKEDLERHVQEVNALLRKANGDLGEEGEDEEDEAADGEGPEEEWIGFEEPAEINREEEYIDEDKYTTVTVETVDISKSGFVKLEQSGSDEDSKGREETAVGSKSQTSNKRIWTKEKPSKDRPKKKKKKFRYESKADRKVTRLKERSKNRDQAKARRS